MTERKQNTIVIDLDDTICYPNHDKLDSYEKYGMARPNLPLIAKIVTLHDDGWIITLATARRMLTHGGDVAKIVQDVGDITETWLKQHGVPYHNICFGKPYGQYYVDDKAMTLDTFLNTKVENF